MDYVDRFGCKGTRSKEWLAIEPGGSMANRLIATASTWPLHSSGRDDVFFRNIRIWISDET